MASQTQEAVSVLNELIQICEDGAVGYKKAAEDVEEVSLKTLFSEFSLQRTMFSTQLQSAVAAYGEKPSTSGHVAGALHRGWMSVKEVTGNKDKAIIDECEAGEDRAMKAYKEALEKNLPAMEVDLINRQFTGVKAAHDRMRALKHSRANN